MANNEKSERRRPPRTAKAAPGAEAEQRTVYTTFILYPDQLTAIKQAALRMQGARGGKADQSEVLRLALDAIATGAELPHGLKESLAAGIKERRQIARNGGGGK